MPKSPTNKSYLQWLRRKFGHKEIASIAAAIGITLLAVWTYDPDFNYISVGYGGLFLAALIGNATVILPAPVVLLVFAAGSGLENPLLVGLIAGTGATLGEVTGYLAGYSGNKVLEYNQRRKRIEKAMRERGFWYILILAFIPNPLFDVAGIVAGALRYPWQRFFIAAYIGKTLKMTLIALAGAYSIEWLLRII